ncbi:MAG: VCBS repeat-containing protein, partial [Phycisphaerales bacterium]|nr:VCBS repeat-containing protein [Phycisphaerales bacterium]
SLGGGAQSVVMADIDNDGDLDFVGTNKFGSQIRPYRNINGLGFNSIGLFDTGDDPYDLIVADTNRDGFLDVLTCSETADTITVCFNDGTGLFPTNVSFPTGTRPVALEAADFDGDGHLDIVTADWGDFGIGGDTVSVLLGDQEGGFLARVSYSTHALPSDVAVADFNGDGALDIAVACLADDVFGVLLGNGDGTFQPEQIFDAHAGPRHFTTGDFDGDGDIDVAGVDDGAGTLAIMMNLCDQPGEPPAIDIVWHQGHDNIFNIDNAKFATIDPSGNPIMVGTTAFTSNEEDYHVVKFDSDGNELWAASYDGTGNRFDNPIGVGTDIAGSIYVSGQSRGTTFGLQWATVKFTPSGALLWARRYDGGNPDAQQVPQDMAVNDGGTVAVCGWARDASFQIVNFAVVAYDGLGNELWDIAIPNQSSFTGVARRVAFDGEGNVIATGYVTDDDEFGEEMYTAKISPLGDVLWTKRFDGTTTTSFNETEGLGLFADNGGNIYVTGSTYTTSQNLDVVIAKYAPDGTELFARAVTRPGFDDGVGIHPYGPGFLVVSTTANGIGLEVFDTNGTSMWYTSVPESFGSNSQKRVTFVDDQIYVATQNGSDIDVHHVDESGTLISTTRIDSGASDTAVTLNGASDGHLYLGGIWDPEVLNRNDFSLFKLLPEGTDVCAVDLNGDTLVDIFDILAFVGIFQAGGPQADWNGDTIVDIFDVLAYLADFEDGCPGN